MDRFFAYKAIAHSDKIIDLTRNRQPKPIKLFITPTGRCGYNCTHCFVKNQAMPEIGDMPFDLACQVIDDAAELGCGAVSLSGGGEPLLYPQIRLLLDRIYDHGMFIDITTNGAGLYNDLVEVADSIRISFDAGAPQLYADVHGVSQQAYFNVIGRIEALLKARHELNRQDASRRMLPSVGVLFVVTEQNKHNMQSFINTCISLGVDYGSIRPSWRLRADGCTRDDLLETVATSVKSSPVPIYVSGSQLKPTRCYAAALIPAVRWDGKMMLCQSHQDRAIADLTTMSLKDAWNSGIATRAASNIDISRCWNMCCMNGFNHVSQNAVVLDSIVRCMV